MKTAIRPKPGRAKPQPARFDVVSLLAIGAPPPVARRGRGRHRPRPVLPQPSWRRSLRSSTVALVGVDGALTRRPSGHLGVLASGRLEPAPTRSPASGRRALLRDKS